jgi:3-hydroxybutyryl-CoA dehydratase
MSQASPFALDFDALAGGERFVTRGRTITEADIVQFAAMTGDMHPQHTDAAWAAESRFGERIAHGMLVMSYAIGLVPLDPERVVALRRVTDVVFKHPVYIGDTIHVDGRIETLKPVDPSHGLVEALWKIVTQRGRTVARARAWNSCGAARPWAPSSAPSS